MDARAVITAVEAGAGVAGLHSEVFDVVMRYELPHVTNNNGTFVNLRNADPACLREMMAACRARSPREDARAGLTTTHEPHGLEAGERAEEATTPSPTRFIPSATALPPSDRRSFRATLTEIRRLHEGRKAGAPTSKFTATKKRYLRALFERGDPDTTNVCEGHLTWEDYETGSNKPTGA